MQTTTCLKMSNPKYLKKLKQKSGDNYYDTIIDIYATSGYCVYVLSGNNSSAVPE
jgi:hypothetical protein